MGVKMAHMRSRIWKRLLLLATIIVMGMLFLSSVVPLFATAESISNEQVSEHSIENIPLENAGQIKKYSNDFFEPSIIKPVTYDGKMLNLPDKFIFNEMYNQNITLEFNFSRPQITKNVNGYDTITIQGLHNWDEPGTPLLPFKTVRVLLPQGRDVDNINVMSTDEIVLDGAFILDWGKMSVPLCSDNVSETTQNATIYSSSSPYPGKVYSSIGLQKLRGYNVLIINLHPVKYLPAKGEIHYFKHMDVIVSTKPTGSPIDPSFRGLPQDEERIKEIVDNPAMGDTYHARVITKTARTTYDYVIITDNSLVSSFQPLATWKSSIGITTIIETIQNITANYTGNDTQEKIRNFIKDAYTNWGIEYVLLGGDDEIIPHRGCYGYVYSSSGPIEDDDIPCDLYYGALDGTWDDNKNGIYGEWGEEDLYAEIYVGRATVDTSTEASNFVNKTLAYEQTEFTDLYLLKALMIGEKLWSDPDTWGGDCKDEIKDGGTYNGYTTTGIPDNYTVTTLYDRDGTFSDTAVKNELNNGQHLVNHLGHSWWNSVMGLSPSEVDALTNTKYFIGYSQGCYPGAFDQGTSGDTEAVAEHFIFTEHGAVAVIMNSRYGWGQKGGTGGASQRFDRQFFDAIFGEGIINLGKANQDSKEDNAGSVASTGPIRWCYFEITLFGDPSLRIGGGLSAGLNNVGVESVDSVTAGESYVKGQYNINTTVKNYGATSQSNFNVSCEIKEISTERTTIFSDDMEAYTNPNRGEWKLEEWYRDVGDWECGTPTNVGPSSAHSGTNCWGTNLDGNYDNYGQTTFAGFVWDQGWLVDAQGRNDFIDIPAQAGDHIYVNISWTTGADINMRLYKPSDVLDHLITGNNYIAYGFSGSTQYETINYTTTPADGSGIYKLRIYLWYGGDTSYTINEITVDNVTYTDSDYLYSLKRVDDEGTGYEYPEVTFHYFYAWADYSSYSISYIFEDNVDLTLYDPDGNAIVGNYYDDDGYWYGTYTADKTGIWVIKMIGEGPDYSPDNYTVYVSHPSHYAWLISPVIDLTDPNIISAEYSFWHWYNLEENYDYGYVCVGIVGSYWYLSEYYTGNNSEIGWMKETINLDSFIGYKIRLGFAVITDSIVTRPGWYIDDIIVNKTVILSETTVYGPDAQTITANLAQDETCSINWSYNFQNSTYYRVTIKTLLPDDQRLENDEKSIIIQVVDNLPSILLVDSVYGNDDRFFRASLDAKGYNYTLAKPVEERSWYSVLTQYTVVIWATTGYLTETQQSNLQKYLENGGSLFISGEDVGYYLVGCGYGSDFYINYLHATYIRDDTNAVKINGVTGDPITDGLTNLDITGDWPDEIAPGDMYASTIFKYPDETSASIKVDTGMYRVVYLACKYFEGNDPLSQKTIVMDRIIKWLPNQPPEITSYTPITNPTINENETITFSVNASDPNNDTLTISWYLNESLVDTDLSYTFVSNYDSAGVYNITAAVFDGSLYANHSWTLSVLNVNRAPTIDSYSPLSDPTITEEELQLFTVSASDPDDDTLTINWYLNDSLLDIGSSYTFVANYTSAGWYNVKVVVSDGELSVNRTWILTVTNINRAPAIDSYLPLIEPTITEEESQSFNITASDPDIDDVLNITWKLNDTIVGYGESYTFIGNYTSAGSYEVKVVVSDGILYANHTWVLTVTNVNRAPVLTNPLPDKSFDEDCSLINTFNLNDYFSDPDAECLNYTVSGNCNVTVVINDNGTVEFYAINNWYGNETITFRATDPYNEYVEDTIIVTVTPVNDAPTANFIYIPENPTTIDIIQFTDESTDSDGYIVSWYWEFGDGTTSPEQNPEHQYADDGTYYVNLTVTDDGSVTNICQKVIVISNVAPTAEFTYSPSSPTDLETVTFIDTSTDSDGSIVSWYWEFGDGTTSVEQNPTHQYADDGGYYVNLTVTDNDGASESRQKVVVVSNVGPVANFTYVPTEPTTADIIQFRDDSTDSDGTIVSWYWEFGDGSTSTAENPEYQYADGGTYYVNLTVTDDDGVSNPTTKTIIVTHYTSSEQPPTNVTLTITEITENSVLLLWSQNNDADFVNYTIYVSKELELLGNVLEVITNRETTEFNITNLSPSTVYYITVRIYDTEGLSNDTKTIVTTPSAEVTETIGPTGGNITIEKLLLVVPENALSENVSFNITTVSATPPEGYGIVGSVYNVECAVTTFTEPITITLSYEGITLPEGVTEEDLVIYKRTDNTWNKLGGTVDKINKTISVEITTLSEFAIFYKIPVEEEEEGKSIGLPWLYILIPIIIIIVLVGAGLGIKKKKALKIAGPPSPPSKPVMIRCPKCGGTFQVTLAERPLSIVCSKCGAKGTLK